MIGLIGTGYFAGYLVGCFVNPRLVKSVGHIRVFAAYSAIAGASTLLLFFSSNRWVWIGVRALAGFCFSGLFMVMEGWINGASTNQTRARVFSIFRMVDMSFVAAGQFLMPIVGLEGFAIYALISMVTCISVVPVALATGPTPNRPKRWCSIFRRIWKISPLACGGCLFVGLTNTAFRLIAPIYVTDIGFDLSQVATLHQHCDPRLCPDAVPARLAVRPSGPAHSDHACLRRRDPRGDHTRPCAADACRGSCLLGSFIYGGLSLPLYPLLAAHANDRAQSGQYVVVAAGLSTFFSIGAIAGPLLASELYVAVWRPWIVRISGRHAARFVGSSFLPIRPAPQPSSGRVATKTIMSTRRPGLLRHCYWLTYLM